MLLVETLLKAFSVESLIESHRICGIAGKLLVKKFFENVKRCKQSQVTNKVINIVN